MSYFAYRSLTPDLKRIRLINLLPRDAAEASVQRLLATGIPDSNISVACTISHVSLDRAPPYYALSYAWGDASQCGWILVGDTPFRITKSLEVALLHLIPEDKPLTLWIDSLCINQAHEAEKSEQVQQMHQIYSQAVSVIAWLGPASDDSDSAMLWIQQYGSQAKNFGIGTKMELRLRNLMYTLSTDPSKLSRDGLDRFLRDISSDLSSEVSSSNSITPALSKFFRRAYWSRLWVVQELVHGQAIEFVCGSTRVSENALHHSLRLVRNYGQYELLKSAQSPQLIRSGLAATADVQNPINMLKVRRGTGSLPFMYLIRLLQNFQATDPRDKIFAILSCASDAEALGLYADYRKVCAEVYLGTAKALVSNGFFDVFSFCEHEISVPGLGSWVPNFAKACQRSPLQERALKRKAVPVGTVLQPNFSAAEGAPAGYVAFESSTTEPTSLHLLAKHVDSVEEVGARWEGQGFSKWLRDLSRLWMARSSTVNSVDLRAVWRTAVADQEIRCGNEKPRLSEAILARVHELLTEVDLDGIDEKTFAAVNLGDYAYQLQDIAHGRRPFRTASGHIGVGPFELEVGDLIYIVPGATVPYIFRGASHVKATLIGEAFVYNMMDGEAVADGQGFEILSIG
jgi:hypothetical protein